MYLIRNIVIIFFLVFSKSEKKKGHQAIIEYSSPQLNIFKELDPFKK